MFSYQFLLIARVERFAMHPRTARFRRLIQTLSLDPTQLMRRQVSSFDGARPQPSLNCWKRPR